MTKLEGPTTDAVVRLHSRKKSGPKLTMAKLDRDTILIEGDAAALRFLGQFILAHSRAKKGDCHNGLHPKGAGNAWFTKQSTLGFYLHKLPCDAGHVAGKKLNKK
ncbi:MAG TPA: hypothetical protein VFF64_18045 [Candidatus Eremiobacteraceae bacterium]|nr:hypothetical protein [Candidatus Eremiobacteraceae bacterium]